MTTREIFEAISYSSIDWPGRTTRLGRDSLQDYLQRPASGSISIAELYHENSKLHPSNAATILAAQTDARQFSREMLQRSASAARVSSKSGTFPVPDKIAGILHSAKVATGVDLFYAIDLRLLLDSSLLIWEPVSEAFTVVKRLSEDERAMLNSALDLMEPRAGRQDGPLLFVLGWFARNDLLLGPRGYRRTLLDAGRVIQEIVNGARVVGLETELVTEFTDFDVDRAVEVDGCEEGAVALIRIQRSDDDRDRE